MRSNGISISISDADLKKATRNLSALKGFSGQKRSIRDAAYKALTPVVKAARQNAPVRQDPYTGKEANSKRRGTLKRSIGKKKARNAPVAIAGPRSGKNQRFDGFYGQHQEKGTKRGIAPNPFMERALNSSKAEVSAIFSRELDVAFDKYSAKALKK